MKHNLKANLLSFFFWFFLRFSVGYISSCTSFYHKRNLITVSKSSFQVFGMVSTTIILSRLAHFCFVLSFSSCIYDYSRGDCILLQGLVMFYWPLSMFPTPGDTKQNNHHSGDRCDIPKSILDAWNQYWMLFRDCLNQL